MADSIKVIFDAVDNTKGAINSVSANFAKVRQAATLVATAVAGVALAVKKASDSFTNYSDQVKAVSRVTGATAEESSQLIQVADDLFISYENLSIAMKAAVKNGIEPNIESLAKLSDRYLELAPGLARSTFLLENFGKTGLEMGKLLEVGADGIRKMADATPEGLILSADDIKTADALKVAFDGLSDSIQAFGLKIIADAAPTLLEFISYVNQLISALDESYDIWGRNIQQIDRYAAVTENNKRITRAAIELFKEQNQGLNNSWEAWQRLTPEIQAVYIAEAKAAEQAGKTSTKLHNLPGTLTEAGIAARDAAQGIDELADSMAATDQLNFILSFQARSDDFEKTRADILEKMTALKDEILAATEAGDFEALPGLKEDMVGLTGDLNKNEAEWKQWQKQTAFSLISTKALAAGVDLESILKMGEDFGVLDPAVVEQAQAMLDAVSGVETTGLDKAVGDIKYLVSQDGRTIKIFVEQEITTNSSGIGGSSTQLGATPAGMTLINYGTIAPKSMSSTDLLAEFR